MTRNFPSEMKAQISLASSHPQNRLPVTLHPKILSTIQKAQRSLRTLEFPDSESDSFTACQHSLLSKTVKRCKCPKGYFPCCLGNI